VRSLSVAPRASFQVEQREKSDVLAEGIVNIVAVTGAAGASTAILGAIGWFTLLVLPGL
jgi:hypothetical protein